MIKQNLGIHLSKFGPEVPDGRPGRHPTDFTHRHVPEKPRKKHIPKEESKKTLRGERSEGNKLTQREEAACISTARAASSSCPCTPSRSGHALSSRQGERPGAWTAGGSG